MGSASATARDKNEACESRKGDETAEGRFRSEHDRRRRVTFLDRGEHRKCGERASDSCDSFPPLPLYTSSSMAPKSKTPKRVLVVGAGAAGMSCAEQLSKHPDRFEVTLVEAQDYCGGQAFSIGIDEKQFGASWMNQGVQGSVSAGCGILFDPMIHAGP